jgi:hypothetical protein
VSAAGILGVATAASTTARSPLARSAATRAWIDGARDPSAAGGALAFMRPDGQAILYAPGTQTQFPADRVAIGGRLVAVVAGGEVRVADRATGVQRLALPAPGADAVAVADRWVAIRRRMGGRDAIQAAAVPAPPPGAVEQAASEGAGRPTLRTVARAREPQQLGRPALAGDRLVFHVTGRRTSRIDEVNLATGARRALRRGGMRRLLTNPSLSSGRLLYVETTPYHQALVLGPRIARRGRTLLRIAPAIEADRGYATPHGPHRPGARRPRRPPREGPPGTTTTLWTTALAPDAAYVTRLRARHGRTRAALLRVALRPGGRAGARWARAAFPSPAHHETTPRHAAWMCVTSARDPRRPARPAATPLHELGDRPQRVDDRVGRAEVGSVVGPSGDGQAAGAVGAGAGDVERGVADDDRLLGRDPAGAGAGDGRQLGAVLVVGAEAALAAAEVVGQAGPGELDARDRLEVAGDERQPDVGARGEHVEQLERARGDGAGEVLGVAPGVLLGGDPLEVDDPLVEALGRQAELEADRAGDLHVGAPGDLDRGRLRVPQAVHAPDGGVEGVAVVVGRAQEQRPVDVEEQEHERSGPGPAAPAVARGLGAQSAAPRPHPPARPGHRAAGPTAARHDRRRRPTRARRLPRP